MNIPLPRLLDDQLRQRALLHPTQLSISLNLTPLSTAQMTLPDFDAAAQPGDYVELFTAMGSAGIFRIQKIERNHQGLRTVYLEHGLVSLADSLISASGEQEGAPLDIMTQLLAHQASPVRWQLGRVEVPADKLLTWKWDYSNVLESLLSLMQELPDYALAFDQRTTPWTLNIIACTDQAACECRLNRNLLSLKVTVDRTELCTRLYIPPPDPEDEDAEPQEPVILNADTQSKWGVVSRSLSGDPGLTQEELLAEGQHYLALHKEPLISVSMDARDMSAASGQSFDRFTLGRVCRVCLPAQKETIRQRIVSIVWPDVYRKPELIRITLANKTSTAGSMLSGLIVDTTVLRKQVTKNWNALQEQEYILIEAKKNITLISEEIDLIGKEITIQASDIVTLKSGLEENEAAIVLANGRITANANAISLQAKNVLTLEAGVAENKAAIALANGDIALMADDITANANAIALKADQASLDLANGRIDAQANEIALKADLITLDAYVKATTLEANYAKLADLNSVRASISNLTSGLTTATVINSNVINGSQINTTYLSANSFTHNGAIVSQRSITMGSVTSVGKALSTGGELDLQHSHAVTVNEDGTVTLGEVSAEGGNFKIADTKVYKDGVSAAYGNGYNVGFGDGKDAYLPTAINRTGYSAENKTVTVRALNAHQDLLTGQVIDATEIYNTGWNECRDAMTQISNLYTISQTAPGTLYMLVNGNYTSVGSSWVQVSSYTSAYRRPAAIA